MGANCNDEDGNPILIEIGNCNPRRRLYSDQWEVSNVGYYWDALGDIPGRPIPEEWKLFRRDDQNIF